MAAGSQGQMMRASDRPTVDTSEFLLARLSRRASAVASSTATCVSAISTPRRNRSGASPARGHSWPAMPAVSGSSTCAPSSRSPSGVPMAAGFGHPYRSRASRSRGRSSYMVFVRDITTGGRTPRADRASEPGGRQDHPRRRPHRSQPARRLYQCGVLQHVRIFGR